MAKSDLFYWYQNLQFQNQGDNVKSKCYHHFMLFALLEI